MKTMADVFDGLAVAGAIGAVAFFFISLPDLGSGPEFLQVGLFCLMLAIIPYCLAGAVHRMWQRTNERCG